VLCADGRSCFGEEVDRQAFVMRTPALVTAKVRFALGLVPNRHDDVSTSSRKVFRQTEAQAAIGSGDDGEPARQIRDFQCQSGFHHVTGSS